MAMIDESTRCAHTTASGRRCRMPRVNQHVRLCGTHLEAQRCAIRSDPAADIHDVLDGIVDFGSAASIHHLLANLTTLLVDNRVDYRKALVIAYLCQLALQCLNLSRHERRDLADRAGNQSLEG